MQGGVQGGVLTLGVVLQDLVARQHQFSHQIHELVQQFHSHADVRIRHSRSLGGVLYWLLVFERRGRCFGRRTEGSGAGTGLAWCSGTVVPWAAARDENDPYFLSEVGKAFIAGQLRHAREICSIFAQWVNSYKRLVPGYEAPVYVAWSRRNRSALVRVPLYHPGKEQATRMELRCPDPAAIRI